MNTGATISKELIRRIFANPYDGWVSLEDFGDHVLEAFSGIRLIGEIERPEGRETYEELKACLGQFVNGSESALAEVLDYGNKQMRAAFGLYFVWTGIFAYGEEFGHELWPPVLEGLGIHNHDQVSKQRCRELFRLCLEESHLERFAGLKAGHQHVNKVLLHGLIPDLHMDRFIRNVIYPELQSPMGLYETGDSVVRQLCQRNLTLLPKPIQNFIEHGYPVNADVIDRLLHMAREWDDDEPDRWQLWGLPKYMVEAFRKFGETTPEIGIGKSKKTLASARPFLQFDSEINPFPVLIVPPQSTPAPPQFVLRYVPIDSQNGVEESWAPGNTPIKGLYQTDHLECPVGPARNGWTIDVLCSSSLPRRLAVPYEFLVTRRGDELPLFFFNAGSKKLFNARSRDNFPEELIVVYPAGASLDLVGGQTWIESQALYGEWGDWQYMACSLEIEGAFEYHGPDVTFGSILTECFDFRRTADQEVPTLSGDNPPSWFRCLEPLPIFAAAKPIQIHCRGDIYHLWQRGNGRLTRLDVLGRPIRFELAFYQEGPSWRASLPEPLEPGVYELRLQGALGAGDIAYSFVYFPVTRFSAVFTDPADAESLVRHFHIEAESPVDLHAHHNTRLEYRENGVVVSPKAEGARAFCAVRAFAGSRFPVTILLARRDVRWCRRRESGLIAWEEWLAQPQALPIQKVDELQDARVAVQMDQKRSADVLHRPLRLLLKGKTDGTEERDLMSLNASGRRRETHPTWVFDLKQFSDQLKNLREYHTADITIDLGREHSAELLLLSLLRFPEYKDLRLTRLNSTNKTERYEVAWMPEPHDPRFQRVLSCRPEAAGETDITISRPLEDKKQPPFIVELPEPSQPAWWKAWVSIQSSRFGQGQSEAPAASQFRWFRTPEGWQDWLTWPDINHKDLGTKIGSFDALSQDSLRSAFPWMYFLAHFHQKAGREAFHRLQAIIGDEVLLQVLPIRCGGLLNVKSGARRCLSFLITETKFPSDLYACFPDLPPSQWRCFPDDAELSLRLKSPHHNFEGQSWSYQKRSGDPSAIMTSDRGENLDFNIWLEDALDPSTKGIVEARYPVEFVHKHPPLPVLSGVPIEDTIMPSLSISRYERSQPWQKNTGLTIGDRISPQMREKMELLHPGSEETKMKAYNLIEGWRRWLSTPGLNPLLSRIVSDYVNANSAKALSGIAALIFRLKAHGYERAYVTRPDHGSDDLLRDTLEFVRSLLPSTFLQDLILHEIVISWYWQKSLVTYEGPRE